ncbi:MAG: SDR family NAD(P)-dependent oxidoreductase [Rectinemataceae bacterium]
MQADKSTFQATYGPWCVIVGGSEGLGAEFARQLAARGLNLVLAARRPDLLKRFSDEIAQRFGVRVLPLELDLADPRSVDSIADRTSDLEIGLLICNAASSPIGPFLGHSRATHCRLLEMNCRAPALLAWEFGRRLSLQGRGGIILVSSMAGFQGTGHVAHYAASKAYVRVLAEGLWDELRGKGLQVLACCPGIVSTPTFQREGPVRPRWLASPLMECAPVVAQTLRALGRKPVVVPGTSNKVAAWFTQRLLPRRLTIALAGRSTRAMYSRSERKDL